MPDDPNAERKIVIDEDWKSQVEAERAQVAQKPADSPSADSKQQPDAASEEGPFPEPSLAALVTTLATQALIGLGQIAHPATGKAEVRPAEARYFIDTIEVLGEKTKGNRTPDESKLLDNILHELRLGYLEVSKST